MYAAFAQECDHTVDCKTLTDATRVQLHWFAGGEPNGVRGRIELHLVPSDFVAEGLLFLLRRHMTVLRFKAPGPQQRAYRDVERAVRTFAPVEGLCEEAEGLRVRRHRPVTCFAADPR